MSPTRPDDVARPRLWLLAGAIAAVAALLGAVFVPRAQLAAPGSLSAQHVAAGLRCASCHGDALGSPVPTRACTACHGSHPSTRAPHRVLEARGAMTCATCHAGHDAPEVVPVAAGRVARVPLSACSGCHDSTRSADPVRACLGTGSWQGFSACLDEHQTASTPLASSGVCRAQHSAGRFAAWEQARVSTDSVAASFAPRGPGFMGVWIGSGLAAGAFAWTALRRRRPPRAGPARGEAPVARARVRLPRIDATRCLGCHACVDACPFDVMDVQVHVAVVARPDACCGVGTCETACPNGSLRLVEHDEPIADRPRATEHLESLDVPGIYVAGDLTGIPLIRHAIAQGARVAEHVHQSMPARAHDETDLVVVGAGPAGLSAALRARELGMRCVVLEQGALAASIRAFPRGKIVHDAPLSLPLEGPLWLAESTKEELVAQWTRIARTHRIDVREGHWVTGVKRAPSGFLVTARTTQGEAVVTGARVLLAVGRRGSPRLLDAPVAPSAAPFVLSSLSDARAWAGKRVLVAGLGDSAMEAVVALARQAGTTVTLVGRAADFTRGSRKNVAAVRRLAETGRVCFHLQTRVVRVEPGRAVLDGPTGTLDLPTDVVFALLGGEPPRALLAAAGVRLTGA